MGTTKADKVTIRISPALRDHIISLGPVSAVIKSLVLLGLESVGHDISDVYREMSVLSTEVTDPALEQLLIDHFDSWFLSERNARGNARTAPDTHSAPFTHAEWAALCAKYGNICLACGQLRPLTADHIVPRSKGGAFDISNIQPLCGPCNSSKGDRTIDYRPGAERHED